ncbi:MAG TPA: glycosyltransferase [Mycobacteriales bacterium]|nr:glycosyltransferase [Mycobacteriales bacterium]
MSRYLIITLPLAGHVNPTIGIARELVARGHEVAWVGSEMVLRPMLGPDATILPTGSRLYRAQGGQGAAAVKSLWKSFVVPYARFVLPAVEKAVHTYQPDVLLVDQHAPAGGIVADRHGLPWAALVSSSMELTRPFAALPKVEEWVAAQVEKVWTEAGVPAEQRYDLRFSPHLVIALTSPALTGPVRFPDHYALVGPILADRPPTREFPWDRLDPDRRKVLVCLGTLQPEHVTAFYPRAAAALAGLPGVQGIIAAGPQMLPDPPANVLVAPWVPMLELLPRVDAVVCHGGMNTVCETLAHGVPLAMGPLINDQPVTANQVVAAGAGIRILLRRIRPDELRAVVTTLLDDPAYRAAAERVRDDFAAAGGARTAAERLERLAHPGTDQKSHVVPERQDTLA